MIIIVSIYWLLTGRQVHFSAPYIILSFYPTLNIWCRAHYHVCFTTEDFEAWRDEEICSRLHICEVVELEFVSEQAGKLPKNILN